MQSKKIYIANIDIEDIVKKLKTLFEKDEVIVEHYGDRGGEGLQLTSHKEIRDGIVGIEVPIKWTEETIHEIDETNETSNE